MVQKFDSRNSLLKLNFCLYIVNSGTHLVKKYSDGTKKNYNKDVYKFKTYR